MSLLTAHVVNGTVIVPADIPPFVRPDELDKLGSLNLLVPTIVGGIVLLVNQKYFYKHLWTYQNLAVLWLWSVALVGAGVFTQLGHFNHLTDFLAILHIQIEWLIISLLLSLSAHQAYVLSSLVGTFLYLLLFALPGIRGTFLATSLTGGFGDVFMPLLLLYGGQRTLALGAVGHFVSAYLVFRGFVQYMGPSVYLPLQFAALTVHSVFIVVGVLRPYSSLLTNPTAPGIRLEADESAASLVKDDEPIPPNPLVGVPLTKATIFKLALIALVVDLVFGLPINMAPRPYS